MIAQIGPLAELVAAEALRHLPAVIRKKKKIDKKQPTIAGLKRAINAG